MASWAKSSISSVERARSAPNSASTAPVTASSPAMAAVWERADASPSRELPTFITTTGLRAARAAARAATKLAPSRMPSA